MAISVRVIFFDLILCILSALLLLLLLQLIYGGFMLLEKTVGQAQLILGYIGQVSTVIVLIIPMCTTLKDAWEEGSVGERSALPFLAALFNSGVWILYGQISSNQFVTWLNVAGAYVQSIYFTFFLFYSTAAQRRRWIGYFSALVIGYGGILGFYFYFTGRRSQFRVLCGVSGLTLAFIPLLNVPAVWCSMSMRSMSPLPIPLASLVNGAVWTSYAYVGTEILYPVAFSGIAAVVSASVQILLHGCCHVVQ